MLGALFRVGGATARRSASRSVLDVAAHLESPVSPATTLAGWSSVAGAARLGSPAATLAGWSSVAGAGRLGFSASPARTAATRLGPSSTHARGVSTNSPPPGLTNSERLLYEKLTQMEESHTVKMHVCIRQTAQLDENVSAVSKLLGEHASASTAAVRQTATETVIVLGVFITSILLLIYGIASRAVDRASMASTPAKSAGARASDNAAVAAELGKAMAHAERAAASLVQAADKMQNQKATEGEKAVAASD